MKPLIDLLQFSRTERLGAAVLTVCCLLAALTPILVRHYYRPPLPDFSQWNAMLATYHKAMDTPAEGVAGFEFDPNTASEADLLRLGLSPRTVSSLLKYRSRGGKFRRPEDLSRIYTLSEEDYRRLRPFVRIAGASSKSAERSPSEPAAVRFPFDPNLAVEADLLALGIPKKVAHNILRYREKGGSFRKKADFARIYGMTEALMAELEPYLLLPEQQAPASAGASTAVPVRTIPVVDINVDGPEIWDHLPGIGAARARQILSFREKLGGFSSIQQVAETRGLPDSVFRKIEPFLRASPITRPLRINYCTKEELAAHPYLSYKQAALIEAYREQHGPFRSVEDILRIPVLQDREWLQKLQPYLSFEPPAGAF